MTATEQLSYQEGVAYVFHKMKPQYFTQCLLSKQIGIYTATSKVCLI